MCLMGKGFVDEVNIKHVRVSTRALHSKSVAKRLLWTSSE